MRDVAFMPERDIFHAGLPVIPYDGHPSEVDGHAYALVGFNEQGFVLQNSWGPGWGAGGFAVLTYVLFLAVALLFGL